VTLSRDEVVGGWTGEMEAFESLIRGLDATQWQAPTRCDGWNVRDVAAHVTGTLADVVNGRFDGLGTPEVTEREVSERRDKSPAEMADELDDVRKGARAIAGGIDETVWNSPGPTDAISTFGWGVESLWYDTFMHAQDIRAALGQPPEAGAGLRACVSHVGSVLTQDGWRAATLALDGMPVVDVSGGGEKITGDPMAFVLAATGRTDPSTVGLDESVNIYRDS
jgi:uncharacterized protein (TIGR03083 family)